MFELIGALIGGVFRLAPEVLKILDRKFEREHELKKLDVEVSIAKMQAEFALQQGHQRLQEHELDAEQLSRLRQLTGEAVERTLAPRVDALNRIEDPRVRATRIEKIVEKAREAGRKQFMAENIRNPEFREAFVKYRQEQRGVFKEDLPRFDVGR